MPVKVKPEFQVWALAPVFTRAAPEVLFSVMPEPNTRGPVPKAEALPMLTEPRAMLRPPVPVPAPESVRVPAPALVTGAVKVTPPERVRLEPLAPVPSTVQAWTPCVESGAEIVTAPALAWTSMPLFELPG